MTNLPDSLMPETIRSALPGGEFAQQVHHFHRIDSTMNEAGRLAAAGSPHGTLVIAEEQTAGRGRFGRSWHSEPGAGIYFTLILRPPLAPADAPILTLLAGVALAEAVSEFVGLTTDVRWPNDLMVGGKKCAGILVEMTAAQSTVSYVLMGIGVNVNQARIPDELAAEATSLRIEAGRHFSRLELLIAMLQRLERYYHRLLSEGAAVIVQRFSEVSSYAEGKRVKVTDGPRSVTGMTAGLSPTGVLRVRRDDGKTELILSGQVRPE